MNPLSKPARLPQNRDEEPDRNQRHTKNARESHGLRRMVALHVQKQRIHIDSRPTLAAAWADFLKGNPPDDKAAFTKAWMDVRNAALTRIGMDPVF